MPDLAARACEPCRGDVPPLTRQQIRPLQAQLDPGWEVVDGHHLRREYRFPDFKAALAFVNRVGAMAEEQGHHPDVYLAWGRVRIEVWTHKIDGLAEADFVFAAKCDRLYPTT
jgi:4a-hydroxytetrahydrobiopterin dehydratase